MCSKERLIELMHDFVLFDGGIKKLPRVHQYFGIKAAQEHVRRTTRAASSGTPRAAAKASSWCCWPSGFWRTSPTPAWLIITDRDELDKQIERVFTEAGEAIKRTSSGRDLMSQLGQAKPRLLCSLVHKFGRKGVDDFDAVHQGTGSAAQPDRRRAVRLRGRVPPHPERQAAPDDEGA